MSTSAQLQIAQQLFTRVGEDGSKLVFATLTEGGCAILRDHVIVEVFAKDVESVQRAVAMFQKLTGGDRHHDSIRGANN